MPSILFFVVLFFSFLSLGQLELSGRVVDEAALLSAPQREALEKLLAAHERATGNQVVVVTINSLEGKNIEEFGYELGRKWGIGTKEKDNGVLFIIAPHERALRIEVGYGLEEILTDAKSKIIIERIILPYFRRNEMGEGIIQGAHALIASLGGADLNDEKLPGKRINWISIFYVLIFIILFYSIFAGRSGRGPRPPRGGLFNGFGSSRGGGGFSGGGGSFGGGGASGKW